MQREGESLGPGEIVLAAGDAVLVRGSWEALATHLHEDEDVLVVDEPEQVWRKVVPLGLGAKRAVGVVAAMAALLATGAVPPAVAALLAPGPSSCSAWSASTRRSGRSTGRRWCWWQA